MQKCPNCGYEPVDGCTTCPKCGFSLQLNNQKNNEDVTDDKNDTIEWSELENMPIETVQKMFKDNEEKMKEENSKKSTEETPEMNPILAQYIREHKEKQNQLDEDDTTIITEKANENDPVINDEIIEETENDPVLSSENPVSEEMVKEPKEKSEDATSELNTEEQSDSEETATVEPIVPIEESATEPSDPVESKLEATEEKKESMPEAEPNEENISSKKSEPIGKGPKKSHKKMYITLIALAILGSGGGYYYHHEKEVEAQRVAAVKKENKALDSIESSIASYYTDDKKTFLAADKVDLNPTKIDEELSRYKDNKRYDELKSEYTKLTDKQKTQQAVNQLFTSAAIDGDKLADKPLLKTDQPVELASNTGDQEFDKLMNQAIDNGKEQYQKIEAAKKAADGLLKDGNVIETVNRDQYNAASDAVKAVTNQALIQSQKDELAKVDQTLKDKEKKAADEKAAAEKAAQEKAEQEKAAQEKAAADANQAGDTNSDAYAWAPGVREKVIQTCISRGYIVEGGYSLEPVKIENGEGYYNLYATSNRAPLTKGYSDSDLPMYLVTINCKTGWFKGNGPN